MTVADRTGLLIAQAMGAENVELPELLQRRDEFDAELVKPPAGPTEAHQLLRQWGVK